MNVVALPISTNGGAAYEVLPKVEIQSFRAQALLRTSPEELLTLEGSELASVQAVLGHGSEVGRWVTPRRWFPLGSTKLDVDLRLRILDLMPDQSLRPKATTAYGENLLEQAVITLTRYLITVRMGPSGTGKSRSRGPLDPSYIAELAYFQGALLVALALAKWLASPGQVVAIKGRFMQLLRDEDFTILSAHGQELVRVEMRRMQFLFDRGWWTDLPATPSGETKTTDVTGDAPPVSKERKSDPHLPLPDAYVSEMGRKSLWLIESLAPNLLQLAEQISKIWLENDDGGLPLNVGRRRQYWLAKLLKSWEWKDAEGNIIEQPPFPIRLATTRWSKKDGDTGEHQGKMVDLQWPPQYFNSVMGLLGHVQLAHLFVVALSTGGRKSETLDLRRDCVEYARDGRPYANGRTFKLVRRHDGELRDWVLPDLAVRALEQQVQLVQLVERIGQARPNRAAEQKLKETGAPDHLWAQVSAKPTGDRSKPLVHLSQAMFSFAKAIGMDVRPGNQSLRSHRLRKTVARLGALALAQAPKVLMDVFGHKSIEMTLYYILCDKDLQGDIEQVSRELRVMRAAEAVTAIVAAEDAGTKDIALGGYGGPAALMVQRAVQRQKESTHRMGEDWGASSVRELAEILTLQGKAWEVVRPGVICTKLPGTEAGPCNKSRGRPEPSKCQTDCAHRLEEAFLREDVDGALASCVEEFSAAAEAQDELMQALWAGQIRAHIGRFDDLKAKWSAHPRVQQILADQAETTTEAA